jgi:hypothetical protein
MNEASEQNNQLSQALAAKVSDLLINYTKKENGLPDSDQQEEISNKISELLGSYPELDTSQSIKNWDYMDIISRRTEHHQQLMQLFILFREGLETLRLEMVSSLVSLQFA